MRRRFGTIIADLAARDEKIYVIAGDIGYRVFDEYLDNGNKLKVLTPYTPRPFDHAMSNALHSTMVTNRGLHTSCNGNSQQNRLTPDWPDTVTKETPTEAIYLYDPDRDEW